MCCGLLPNVITYLCCEHRATAALCKVVQGLSSLQLVRACFDVWVTRQSNVKEHQALELKCAGRAAWASAWLQAVRTKNSAADVGLKVYKPTTPGEHSLSNLKGLQLEIMSTITAATAETCSVINRLPNAGMRGRVITDRSDLWKGGPYKPLTEGLRKSGGRNATGRVTSWHRGGAAKRLYRLIDTRRAVTDASGTLERIEYDPNRTARIALVKYPPGMRCIQMFDYTMQIYCVTVQHNKLTAPDCDLATRHLTQAHSVCTWQHIA